MNDIIRIGGKEIKLSKETVDKLKRELQLDKKDYSKFIGRCIDMLAIKGEHYLISVTEKKVYLSYEESHKSSYNYELNYEIVTLKELNLGDVICFSPTSKISELDLNSFGVFIGVDNSSNFRFQTLNLSQGIEEIDHDYWQEGYKKVVRFLRR